LASHAPSAAPAGARKIWVIVGLNWGYNDEYSYPEGDYLTEHAFADKATADQTCGQLIEEFCVDEDPEEFVMPDITVPEEWDEWSREEQWDWLLARTPVP
jgi:hypothetical protein